MESTQTLDISQYLTFMLAGEEYAVGIMKVKEIIEYSAVTRVPRTPAWVRGVFNLRSKVVPVIDLASKFGLQETPITRTTCIIIVEASLDSVTSVMGIMADNVNQVLELAPADIEAPPSFGTHVKVDYLLGMARMEQKFALMLDIDKVLSAGELLQINDIGSPQEKIETGDAAGEESVGEAANLEVAAP